MSDAVCQSRQPSTTANRAATGTPRGEQSMSATKTVLQQITVGWSFPVVFTHAVFDVANPVLAETLNRLGENRRHRAMIFIDSHVASVLPALATQAEAYFAAHAQHLALVEAPLIVPGGEAIKNDFTLVERFMRQMLGAHLDRQSFVIIVGGGAVMDAVGLAAALVHRGLRQIRVPTTVLGQNDAGVGVKNGVNFLGGKNAIGAFAPPFAVLNDFDFLLTLPDRDWLCGVAEAFKVSIIRDRAFFHDLLAEAEKYRARDFAAMQALVIRCAEIHLEHIRTNGDPFEYGRARPLDFGHWSAHKLEIMSGFKIGHGEAVAAGVLLDSIYAAKKGWINPAELAQIRDGLLRSGFRLWFEELEERDADGNRAVFGGLRDFQEHLGGELTVTFPRGIGARHEVHEIDLALMEVAVNELEKTVRSDDSPA
jgi:3-dehydroquinate synthase